MNLKAAVITAIAILLFFFFNPILSSLTGLSFISSGHDNLIRYTNFDQVGAIIHQFENPWKIIVAFTTFLMLPGIFLPTIFIFLLPVMILWDIIFGKGIKFTQRINFVFSHYALGIGTTLTGSFLTSWVYTENLTPYHAVYVALIQLFLSACYTAGLLEINTEIKNQAIEDRIVALNE